MKILVFAYDLVLSGVTVNAVELAAALRDRHGHEVVLFAGPGPLSALADEHRVRVIPAPPAHGCMHPSRARMQALRHAVRSEAPDLIHAWDWVQCIDAYYGEHLRRRVPMLVTDMSMAVPRILPKRLPTTFGTPELVDIARRQGRRSVELLLPPVDVRQNAAEAVDPEPFRAMHGIDPAAIVFVTVSRLDSDMKAESLWRSVRATGALGGELPVQLVIAGDGDLRPQLEREAARINAGLRRNAVILTGALLDPRPAYRAADVVIGMGGSALRGLAFARPVIVVGAAGFSAPLTPETAPSFLYKGMYGAGTAGLDDRRHERDIRALAERAEDRLALGRYARDFVVQHFSLDVVSCQLAELCERAAAMPPDVYTAAFDGLRTAGVWVRERRFIPYGLDPVQWLNRRRPARVKGAASRPV